MSPPKLTRDTPVLDSLHPVDICIFPSLRIELNIALLPSVNGLVCHTTHLYKPLLGKIWLYDCMTSITMTDFMVIVFLAYKISLLIKLFCNHFSCFLSRNTSVLLRTVVIHCSIRVKDIDGFQVMSLSTLPVIRVMGWSNLYHTCTETKLNERICNNWNLSICKRKSKLFPNYILISFIFRVYCNCNVSEHSLWPCCCNCNPARTVGIWISDIIEFSRNVLIFDFIVCQSSTALWAVVYKVLTFIDQSSLI